MTRIAFDCDRCKKPVDGTHGHYGTGGFYVVDGESVWRHYSLGEAEHFVCDECIQSMPLYREVYGS